MANYNLVVNSTFKPFTFDEYIKPYQLYGEAYKAQEDALSELSAKANVWEELANEETDPETYKMYKKYATDLQTQADNLSKYGLNPGSRSALMDLKGRYSKEITPIEQAYTRRRTLADEQREARSKDDTILFDKEANTISLDDLISNPELSYTNYSGKTLASQVGTAVKARAKEMRDNPRVWKNILGDSYYESRMQTGYTNDEVQAAINGDKNAPPELLAIVEDTITSSGIKDWKNSDALARAYTYARQGLNEGVGEVNYQVLENWRAKLAEQEAAKLREELAKQGKLNGVAINPLNIYSSIEADKARNNINNYSKYFTKDEKGNTILTDEGMEEYRRNVGRSSVAGSGGGTAGLMNWESNYYLKNETHVPSEFRKFMDSLGVDKRNAIIDNWNPAEIGSYWDTYLKDNDTSTYDSKKVTEFDYPIASAQQGYMKDQILTANRGLTFKEVDFDAKTNTFKNTGDELKASDLKKNEYKVVATRFSPYGNTVMIQDKNGEVKRYQMPSGINTTNEYNRDRSMQAAQQWSQIINTGTYIGTDGREHKASESEIAYAQQKYQELVQQAYLYHSQLGLQNKMDEQEFKPYGY